jgi:hypothetical protein
MFRIAINKLEKLFARVLASHRIGPGSIPGQDISVSGTLVEDGNDLFVRSLDRSKVTDNCVFKFDFFFKPVEILKFHYQRIRITQIRIKITGPGSICRLDAAS